MMRTPKMTPSQAAAPLQRNLRQRMLDANFNMKSLSKAANLGETAVRDIIAGRSKRPSYKQLSAIATALRCSVDDLTGDSPASHSGLPHGLPKALNAMPIDLGQADLPVRGKAKAGQVGVLIIPVEAPPVDWTYRPAQLRGVDEAFAVFADGDSMYPMYSSGDTLWVHPNLPPAAGKAVLIVKHNDEALVKLLVRRTDKEVLVKEFQPEEREFAIPSPEIRHLYRIIGSLQL